MPSLSPDTITSKQAMQTASIERGVVLTANRVKVDKGSSTGATAVGTIVGAGLGNQIGGGSGQKWATAAGALAGGLMGKRASQEIEDAWAYTVENNQGRMTEVVQSGNLIQPNTPVLIKRYTDGQILLSVDSSQNQLYNRSQKTQYKN